MADSESTAKLPLPTFLKMLTSSNVPAAKAMAFAGKIYKTYNTPASLADLTDFKLADAGISGAEDRKLVLHAVKKAGYTGNAASVRSAAFRRNITASARPAPGTSKSTSFDVSGSNKSAPVGAGESSKTKKKRKREDDRNEFLPDRPSGELEEQEYGSLEFNEVLDEEVLRSKHAVINRAPIMTLWSFIVAERLGFTRQEALSIASVYTEMNAISKGVSIGIYTEDKQKGVEAVKGGSQPYVDLMGRRPLFQTAKSSWRALSSGSPVSPATSFSYIMRSLRQTAPFIVGALRLLADSYSPEELNKHGFSLYAEFRPDVKDWGGRGEVRCQKILDLRKGERSGLALLPHSASPSDATQVKTDSSLESNSRKTHLKFEQDEDKMEGSLHTEIADKWEEPEQKKAKTMTLEEYEATLDGDDTFANVDLDFPTSGEGT